MNEKELFTKFRTELGFEKAPKYLQWIRDKFPQLDIHHLLGSYFGKKMTDYLVIPLTRYDHCKYEAKIGTSYYNKARGFVECMPQSMFYLSSYLEYLKTGEARFNPELLYYWQSNCFDVELTKQIIQEVIRKEQ